MDLLKKAAWTFVVAGGSALALGGGAQAGIIHLLTFDSTGTAPGDADAVYTADPADVIATDGNTGNPFIINRSDGGGVPQVVVSDGPQGGLALENFEGGPGTTGDTGYQIVNSPHANNTTLIAPGGGLTWEALVKVKTYNENDSTNGSQFIVGQGFTSRLETNLSLVPSGTAGKPIIRYNVTNEIKNADNSDFGGLTFEPADNIADDGQWHHLAGTFKVISTSGENLTEGEAKLYLDGVEVASATGLQGGTATATYRVDRWGIGFLELNGPAAHRSFNGFIDGVALSDEVLTPENFVLPIPEPASLGLMGLGAVLVFPRRP